MLGSHKFAVGLMKEGILRLLFFLISSAIFIIFNSGYYGYIPFGILLIILIHDGVNLNYDSRHILRIGVQNPDQRVFDVKFDTTISMLKIVETVKEMKLPHRGNIQ